MAVKEKGNWGSNPIVLEERAALAAEAPAGSNQDDQNLVELIQSMVKNMVLQAQVNEAIASRLLELEERVRQLSVLATKKS